jgi:predicted dehydrogenase
MRFLLVGLGSIGQRHLGNIRLLQPGAQGVVLRRMGGDSPDSAIRVVRSMETALEAHPDFAIVCSPTSCHLQDCLSLAESSVPMLVEKPIASSLEGVQALLDQCRKKALPLMVGYHLRFSPALHIVRDALEQGRIGRVVSVRAEVGQYLPDWRSGSDYRRGVSARRDMGGGVLRELSHEFDYLRWLLGEVDEVTGWAGRLGDLEIDVEDTAEAILRFRSGAVGSVHLDMIQSSPVRSCRILGTSGTLLWDGLSHRVSLHSRAEGGWKELHPADAFDRNAMFLAELEHFISCVMTGTVPEVTGEDGLRALEIALALEASSSQGRTIRIGELR